MKAAVIERQGGLENLVYRDWPDPEPRSGEVVVRIRGCGLNHLDIFVRRGMPGFPVPMPFISGGDMAGEIAVIGPGVSGWATGDRVALHPVTHEGMMGEEIPGGMAEYVRVPTENLIRLAPHVDFVTAAAVPIAYGTAIRMLFEIGSVKAGDLVLILGASGGVGIACLQLCKMIGAKVIAAGASDEKLAIVAETYAPDAIINVTGGFKDQVKELTGGGAAVIYDPVGGDVFDESVRCIAFNGRLLTIGFASGRIPTLPVNMALIKGFSLMGVRAGEYGRKFPEEGRKNLDAVWEMAEAGKLTPRVHAEFPLDDWRAAYDLLANRKVVGKAIIRPDT